MSKSRSAVIYARISQDSSTEREGVRRQVENLIELIDRTPDTERNVQLDGSPPDSRHPGQAPWPAGVFVDNDISARKGSKARRPEYERMMRHILDQDADAIFAAEQSRLWRNNRQASIALDDMRNLPVSLVFLDGPTVKTDDFTGQFLAQVVGAAAALEANLAAQRQQKPIKVAAKAGAYHGAPVFGFILSHFGPDGVTTHPAPKSVGEGRNKKSGFCESCGNLRSGEVSKIRTLVPEEREAEAVREAYVLIDAGLRPYQVCQYLDGQEIDGPDGARISRPAIRTKSGLTWERVGVGSLLSLLRAHRNRGWREWRKGWDGGKPPPGNLIKGNWDGIVSQELFDSVQGKLADLHADEVAKRYKRGPAGNTRAHLLSGIAFGGYCGHRLRIHRIKGKRRYACGSWRSDRCVSFEADPAEAEVERYLYKWLARNTMLTKTVEHAGNADLQKLFSTRRNHEESVDSLDVDYYARTGPFENLSGEARERKYRRLTDHMRGEIDRLDGEIDLMRNSGAAGPRDRKSLKTGTEFRATWPSAGLAERQAIIRQVIDKVLIYPAGAGNAPDPRLVHIYPGSWAAGTESAQPPPSPPDPVSFTSKGKILAFLREHPGEWFTREDISTATGVPLTGVHKALTYALGPAGDVAREWRRRGGQRACNVYSAASGASWGARTRKAPGGAIGAREKIRAFLESDSRAWFTAAEIGAGSDAGNAAHVTRVVNELVTAGFAQRRRAPLPRKNVRYQYSINGR